MRVNRRISFLCRTLRSGNWRGARAITRMICRGLVTWRCHDCAKWKGPTTLRCCDQCSDRNLWNALNEGAEIINLADREGT